MPGYSTYDQVGKSESFADIIANISPFDTPAQSLLKTEKVTARTYSYLEDTYRAAAVNAIVEGADASMNTLADATERSGTCQIMQVGVQVTGTADAISTYGRAKESSYQIGKALREIKIDYEHALVGLDQAAVAGSASAARKMQSLLNMTTTDVDAGSNSTDALTEAKLLVAGQTAYNNGSNPDVFMIKPADSLIVSSFAAASGRNREIQQSTKLVNAVDIYVSSFGTYRVILNRHMKSTHALLMDPSMYKLVTLRPISRTLLAKNGDSDRHQIIGELSAKHLAFADSVKISGLS